MKLAIFDAICKALKPRQHTMPGNSSRKSWSTATWKGSREVQLRAALAMTLRQRFQALEELADLARRLASMPRTSTRTAKKRLAAR